MTRRIAETYAAGGVVVVGVGADGWASLGENSRHALRQARTIIGSPRQLEQLPVWLGARREEWRSPRRDDIRALVEEHVDGGLAVLASGDPLLYGIGRTLVEELGIERLLFLPNLSSVALACARLGWPVESVTVINAPAGGLDTLPGHLAEGARLIVLSAGRDTPATVATRLADQGCGDSALVVLGDLGTDREQRWDGTASGWDVEVTCGLNVVAVTCHSTPGFVAPADSAAGPPAALSPGTTSESLPDLEADEARHVVDSGAAFPAEPEPRVEPPEPPDLGRPAPVPAAGAENRAGRVSTYGAARLAGLGPLLPDGSGQELTGSAAALLSAALLAALDPAPGEMLWEIGGTGAAALAWSMASPGARAALITHRGEVADRPTPFGVAPVQRVHGALPAAAAGLPTPDAVLLVDASAAPGVMETTWRALRLGGRLVGAATTLDEAALLARYHRILGGDLTRLQLSVGISEGEASRYGGATELVLWVRRKAPARRPSPRLS